MAIDIPFHSSDDWIAVKTRKAPETGRREVLADAGDYYILMERGAFDGTDPTAPVLVDERTGELGVATGRITVRFAAAPSVSDVTSWLDSIGFEVVRDFGHAAIVAPRDGRDPLDSLRWLQASDDIVSAEPQLLKRRAKR